MLIGLHGLTGGSHELYLRAVLAPLVDKHGWAACVMNARGCAKSKITTHQLFNARITADVRATVKFLRKTFPNRPLFGIGFSLGANIFANVSSSQMRNMGARRLMVAGDGVVLRGGGRELCIKGRGNMFQPVEPGGHE